MTRPLGCHWGELSVDRDKIGLTDFSLKSRFYCILKQSCVIDCDFYDVTHLELLAMPDDAKFLLDVVLSVKSSSLKTSDRTDETPSGTEQSSSSSTPPDTIACDPCCCDFKLLSESLRNMASSSWARIAAPPVGGWLTCLGVVGLGTVL